MGRGRVQVSTGLILALVLTGCTYADREPGLFGRSAPPTFPSQRPGPANPGLPVVGEAVWTGEVPATGSGSPDLQVRIAVHALRRIPGATVLDYSVTPLPDATHDLGVLLPATVDLGLLDPQTGAPMLGLLGSPAGKFYRPLVRGGWHRTDCLCTPLSQVQQGMHVGQTVVLQAAFPALPSATTTADVYLATVPPYEGVPVSPAGTVPLAVAPVDLGRPVDPVDPADPREPTRTTPVFTGRDGQRFELRVDAVYAARTFTALAWTVHAVTAGAGLDVDLDPTVAPGGQPAPFLHARMVGSGSRRRCLCTDLSQQPARLAAADTRASAVTVLPALPRGTSTVDVDFPGAGALTGLRTTTAPDGTFRSAGPARQPVGLWADSSGPALGWSAADWPTPLPPTSAVDRFPPVVDELSR